MLNQNNTGKNKKVIQKQDKSGSPFIQIIDQPSGDKVQKPVIRNSYDIEILSDKEMAR